MAKLGKGQYRVQSGDSWESIAGKVGKKDQRNFLRIMQANGGYLHAGDVIKIPGSAGEDAPNASISNAQAQSFGMATTDQLKDAYAANGTGGYKSEKMPLGGYRPDGGVNLPGAKPNVGNPALAPVGYGNNTKPAPGSGTAEMGGGGVAPVGYGNNAQIAPGVGTTDRPAPGTPMQGPSLPWLPSNNPLSPGYAVPGTGASSAAAMRAAVKQPQQRTIGGGFDIAAGLTGGGKAALAAAGPVGTALAAGFGPDGSYNPGNIPGNLASGAQDLSDRIFGKTALTGNEKMSAPSVTGGAQPEKPVQYSPKQQADAAKKAAMGLANTADINTLRSKWTSEGKDPNVFDAEMSKRFPNAFAAPDPTTASADTATNGWNWNEPTASGYVSPSGYFVPYAVKTNNDPGVYDYETGKYHPRDGQGGPRTPVQGVYPSNIGYGLITWRY